MSQSDLSSISFCIMDSFDDGTVHIDFDHRQVAVEGTPVDLSPTLYEVLAALVRHQDQVLSPERLMELAWGRPTNALSPSRLQYVVFRLRDKLGWDRLGNDSSPLETVQGQGFRWRSMT